MDAALGVHVETRGPGGANPTYASTYPFNISGWCNVMVVVSNTRGVSVAMGGITYTFLSASNIGAGNFTTAGWRTFVVGPGAAQWQDVRLYLGADAAMDNNPAFMTASTTTACAALTLQRFAAAPGAGIAPPTLPGTVRGGPVHWWSAAAQPGAWGVADLLIDSGTEGGAPADAASLVLVPAVL